MFLYLQPECRLYKRKVFLFFSSLFPEPWKSGIYALWAKSGPGTKCDPSLGFINKILLEHCHTHFFFSTLSMAAFVWWRQNWVFVTETARPTKQKISPWIFTEKLAIFCPKQIFIEWIIIAALSAHSSAKYHINPTALNYPKFGTKYICI